MQQKRWITWVVALIAVMGLLSSCKLPRVNAEDRLFLPLSVEYLGAYILNDKEFKQTPIGGWSGITYDRQNDIFYAISDDRGKRSPARFYTLKATLDEKPSLQKIQVQDVTLLEDATGKPFAPNTVDPEGIALSPRGTLLISSEGSWETGTPPFVGEFDVKTGRLLRNLRLPNSYIPDVYTPLQKSGVQNNRAFESLTLSAKGMASDPFRVFTATEAPLLQDLELPDATQPSKNRMLHYLIQDNRIDLISEHVYPLDPKPQGTLEHGLSDLLAIDQAGHFISIERSFGLSGFRIRLYQVTTGTATDSSTIPSLRGDVKGLQLARKELLVDSADLKINPDNIEGITFGPRLPDGSQSLVLVSDDNFNSTVQATQFLLFRLQGLKA